MTKRVLLLITTIFTVGFYFGLCDVASADALDLYVVSRSQGEIYVVDGATGSLNSTPLATGLDSPNYALFGPDGLLYIAEHSAIRRYDPLTGVQQEATFFELGRRTNGMDFDSDGNLHVMIRDSAVASAVIAIAPDGTGLGKSINDLPIDSGQDVVVGLVSGNLFATVSDYTSIRQFDASGGTGGFQWPQVANFGPDPGPIFAIQEGPDGNLYGLGRSGGEVVLDSNHDTLFKLDGGTGSILLSENIASHSSGWPRSLTFNDDGNVFVGFGWNGTPNVHRYDSDLNHLGEYVSSGLFGDNSGISLAHNDSAACGPEGSGASVPGDFNCDGTVDVADLGIIGANFNGNSVTYVDGDANLDGVVDVADLGVVGANWNVAQSGSLSSALQLAGLSANVIPEPSVLTVLSLGLIGLIRRGRN